ncbi:MAG TPA: glycosyltransferase [Pirellulaceae bacterium]|nr:glycosyltransferase [Pirellulaceae bacterium]
MDFSIIVPLESHRGMAEQCLDGWVTQAFPRERFEILLAAPEKHDQAHLHALANRLAAHDRIIPLPLDHDLALVAEAARQAQGEILVFTEAHCVPERNFLEQSAAIFADHPDWSGFSGRSIPVTHNLLSEIEAEMYNRDITRNMERHQWLKVLDQCFVIRQDAYRACGGVEPQFGHFAEWLLAARLHRQGSRIGFDPRAAIHHYYVGDLEALEEFTLDFAAGQMKFAQSAATDPCGDLFDEVPAWTARHHLNPQVVSCFLRLLANDLFQRAREHGAAPHRLLTTLASWPWRTAWKWLARRNASRRASIGHMRRSISRLLWALRRDLRRGNSSRASLEFERLVNGWVRLARQQYLLDQEGEHDAYAPQPRENYSEWVPGVFETQPACGFHNFEVRGRERFRWSEPSAMLWLPPLKGDWKIGIEWAQLRPFSDWGAARFYLNEQQILPANISHRDFRTEIKYSGDGSTSLRLGWLCPALVTKEDDRHLGLPVSRVAWSDDDQRHKMPVTAARSHESFYFLHVPKCAGTTTRQILANAFAARDILSAYDVSLYYARQLKSCPEIYQPYTLAYGHFRWELPTLVSDRRWRILTIVREPLERLLSAYD